MQLLPPHPSLHFKPVNQSEHPGDGREAPQQPISSPKPKDVWEVGAAEELALFPSHEEKEGKLQLAHVFRTSSRYSHSRQCTIWQCVLQIYAWTEKSQHGINNSSVYCMCDQIFCAYWAISIKWFTSLVMSCFYFSARSAVFNAGLLMKSLTPRLMKSRQRCDTTSTGSNQSCFSSPVTDSENCISPLWEDLVFHPPLIYFLYIQ